MPEELSAARLTALRVKGHLRCATVAPGGRVLVGGSIRDRGVLYEVHNDAVRALDVDAGPIYDMAWAGEALLLCDGTSELIRLHGDEVERCPSGLRRAFAVGVGAGGLWTVGENDEIHESVHVAFAPNVRERPGLVALPEPWEDFVWPLRLTSHGALLHTITERGRTQLWLGVAGELTQTGLKSGDFRVHGGCETPSGALLVSDNVLRVHRSVDGGATFRKHRIAKDTWFEFNGLCCVSPLGGKDVVAAGQKGLIALSRNDGRTFSLVDHPYGSIAFSDAVACQGGVYVVGSFARYPLPVRGSTRVEKGIILRFLS